MNGGSSNAKTSIYDPELNVWTTSAEMNVPRGYQGDAVLPSGDVLTVGGSWSGGIGYKKSEVWNRLSGWRVLSGVNGEDLAGPDPAGQFRSDNHMWLFAYSDRYVLHAGPSAQMHWIDVKGDGRILPAGDRGDDAYAMNGNVVMIGPTKLLKIGGAPAYESLQASDGAHLIDFGDGPKGPIQVTRQRPMAFAPRFRQLRRPAGRRRRRDRRKQFSRSLQRRAVGHDPELWSKSGGNGAFRRLAPMTVPRNYHSIALLMKDARVFVGGGGLCGSPCDTNHPDAEILTPPYLLNDDGSLAARPAITSAPATARLGERISVSTDVPVSPVLAHQAGGRDHSVSNDQRSGAIEAGGRQRDDVRPGPQDEGRAAAPGRLDAVRDRAETASQASRRSSG
ncbi:hypothetical protein [Chenggangzhangella methanolivorans]|uniref:hypothetical protein n=1 Tax=Chenggangzhangella methanolivorans TaxID=1437009 RepID=UPI0021BD0467|nr:hypothetical protein [Chenggangzhangella methanolivorans]